MKVYVVQEMNCNPKVPVPEISVKIFTDEEVAKNFFLEQVKKNGSVIVRVGYKKVLSPMERSELLEIWRKKVWQNFDIMPTKEKYLKITFLESLVDDQVADDSIGLGLQELIGKTIEKNEGGDWQVWGVVKTLAEALAIDARIRMGSHAIIGGQSITEYRIKEDAG